MYVGEQSPNTILNILWQKLVGQTERRDRLQSQVDRLEPEVQNFNSRKDKEEEVSLALSNPVEDNLLQREVCSLLVQVGVHRDLTDSHAEAKASRTAVKDRIKALTSKRRPLFHLAECDSLDHSNMH